MALFRARSWRAAFGEAAASRSGIGRSRGAKLVLSRPLLAALVSIAALAGCSGGGEPEPAALGAGIAFAQDVGNVAPESAPGVSVDALLLKAERRVSRSVVEYDFEVRLRNDGVALDAVTVQLVGAGAGVTIVDGAVAAGALAAGAVATPADTITIRQDRTQPFAPDLLQWLVGAALPPGSASAAIVIDNGVPPAMRAAITQVNTFIDGGPADGAVDVPVLAGSSDTMALALNAADEIVLAAVQLAPDGTLVMGADSTALALVRIAFGPEPDGITVAQLNAAIRAAAGFPTLVGAVNAALAANVAPSAAPEVLPKVVLVLQQVKTTLKSAGASSLAADGAKRRQALPDIEARLPLPYSLLGTTGATLSVHLVGSAVSTVQVTNSLPIYWDVEANGATVSLSPATRSDILLGQISPWLGNLVSVPDAGGPAFTLRLLQSVGSRKENLSNVTRAIFGLAFDRMNTRGSIDIACQNALISVVLGSDVHDQLARAPSLDLFLDYLRDTARIGALDWGGAFRKCFPAHPGRWGVFVGRFVVSISKYLVVADAVGLAYQLKVLSDHWTTDRPIGICQTKGVLFGRNITNCADSFDIVPKQALVPGARTTPTYRAYDIGGIETGLPAALKFASGNSALFTVDANTGEIAAKAVGRAALTISEPEIPASTGVDIDVINGFLVPTDARIDVGQTVRLKLVDTIGSDVVTAQAGLVWDSLHKSVAIVTPLSLLAASPQQVDVQGVAPGKATIYAYNPVSGATRAVEVEVLPPAPTKFKGNVSISGQAFLGPFCSGMMTVSGLATIDLGSNPKMEFSGSEIFVMGCYQDTIPVNVTIPLTVNGSQASGSFSYTFSCGPPCNSGESTWSVNLQRVDNGGVWSVTGTFTHGNKNQTPLNASASGNIAVPVMP